MLKEMKCRIFSVKSMVILSGLLLIAVCAYAQAPEWDWATQAGGTYLDGGWGITLDDYGCCYIIGRFYGTATFGYNSLTSTGLFDIFFAKMSKNGNWSCANKAGGIEPDQGNSITMDASSDAYVTGCFEETASFGSYSLTSIGDWEIFVAKMDASGNWLWATKAGGIGRDEGNGITIDAVGNIYVTGYFLGTATFGSYSITSSFSYTIFVAKMDADGNWLWVTQPGGTNVSYGYGITTDAAGNCHVTGRFSDTATFGSYSFTSIGLSDIFVAKIDAIGDWQWAAQAGGTGLERGIGITIDAAGNSYVTGRFDGTASFGSHSLTSSGSSDIFVAKLNSGVSIDQELNPFIYDINNYPNPFDQRTTINYSLKKETGVCLEVYNLKGQLVETLFEGISQAGDHAVEWDCQDIPIGMYLLKMKAGNEESIRKMVLLR